MFFGYQLLIIVGVMDKNDDILSRFYSSGQK